MPEPQLFSQTAHLLADNDKLKEDGVAESSVFLEQSFGIRLGAQFHQLIGRGNHFTQTNFIAPHDK